MEERNLEFDDDGKIRVRRRTDVPEGQEEEDADELIIDVPGFKEFEEGGEEPDSALFDEVCRAQEEAQALARERARQEALALYEQAEALFAQGDADGAGEKFLDSAAKYGDDWRPWFGVVRVQTNDLTDLSGIFDCQQAYEKALRRMNEEDRAALREKYAPALERRAQECAEKHAVLSAQDEKEREEERPAVQKYFYTARRGTVISGILCGVFLLAAIILTPFVNSVPGMEIAIPAILCYVAALAFLGVLIVFGRRFIVGRVAFRKNARAGTTQAGEEARIFAEEEELIRSILGDLNKN